MELTQEEKMMLAAKQQITLYKAKHDDLTDEDYNSIAEEAHDNLVRSLIEASGEIRVLRELLTRAYEQLLLLGFDSGFANEEIHKLTNDIKKYLEEIKWHNG